MKEAPTGYTGGLWLIVISICMGLGFAGGYLVAANQATTELHKKQADWSAKSNAYATQEYKLAGELTELKGSLTQKDEEIAKHLKKSAELDTQLKDAKSLLARERQEHETEMKQYADVKVQMSREFSPGLATVFDAFEKAKQGFTSIKAELHAGKYKGLEESDGFQILDATFETVPEKK